MLPPRTRLIVGLAVVVLVLGVAAALFGVQYSQAYAQCSASINATACANVSGTTIAADALYVAIAGILAAMVMALSTGVNWRTSAPLSTALATRLATEDETYRRERARRAELQELNALAIDHLAARGLNLSGDMADAEATGSDGGLAPGSSGLIIEEEAPQETADDARRRILADRLRNLARQKPDAIAEVVQSWINQTRPAGR